MGRFGFMKGWNWGWWGALMLSPRGGGCRLGLGTSLISIPASGQSGPQLCHPCPPAEPDSDLESWYHHALPWKTRGRISPTSRVWWGFRSTEKEWGCPWVVVGQQQPCGGYVVPASSTPLTHLACLSGVLSFPPLGRCLVKSADSGARPLGSDRSPARDRPSGASTEYVYVCFLYLPNWDNNCAFFVGKLWGSHDLKTCEVLFRTMSCSEHSVNITYYHYYYRKNHYPTSSPSVDTNKEPTEVESMT